MIFVVNVLPQNIPLRHLNMCVCVGGKTIE